MQPKTQRNAIANAAVFVTVAGAAVARAAAAIGDCGVACGAAAAAASLLAACTLSFKYLSIRFLIAEI